MKANRWSFILTVTLVGQMALAAPTYAQVAAVDVDPGKEPTPFKFSIGYGHVFETDIDDGGDFKRDDYRGVFGAEFGLTQSVRLDNLFMYEYSNYNFSNSSPFQWDDTHFVQYIPALKWLASERWTWMVAPIFRWNWEGGADAGDGFVGGAIGGFNYVSSPTLSIGLVIGGLDQIEDDAVLAPIPVIRWKFADAWMLRTGITELGGRPALGGEVAFKLARNLELSGGAGFNKRRYRLDEQDRVAQEITWPLFAKMTWQMFSQGSADIYAGVSGGEFKVENKRGRTLRKENYDDLAPILGGRLAFTF